MGCRILEDKDSGESVFYCSTTGVAFGPVMVSREVAEKFCQWVPGDPRNYDSAELIHEYHEFTEGYVCECGELRSDQCMYCDDGLPLAYGMHADEDASGRTDRFCEKDPEPEPGERFRCSFCRAKDAAKRAAKTKVRV